MNNIAVIVENRKDVTGVIEQHKKYLKGWRIEHRQEQAVDSPEAYNDLLTSRYFWLSYQEYDNVLIFQHDSGILRWGIEDFFGWDYIGAPWKPDAGWARKDRAGGNGGLSLRNPKKALNLIQEYPYSRSIGNEDVYYTHHLERVGGKVAPYEVCSEFSVETEFKLGSFGYHAIDKHLTQEQVKSILTQYDDL